MDTNNIIINNKIENNLGIKKGKHRLKNKIYDVEGIKYTIFSTKINNKNKTKKIF